MADEHTQDLLFSNPLGDFGLDAPHNHIKLVGRFEKHDIGHIGRCGNEDALHERRFFVKGRREVVFGGLLRRDGLYLKASTHRAAAQSQRGEHGENGTADDLHRFVCWLLFVSCDRLWDDAEFSVVESGIERFVFADESHAAGRGDAPLPFRGFVSLLKVGPFAYRVNQLGFALDTRFPQLLEPPFTGKATLDGASSRVEDEETWGSAPSGLNPD